MIKSHKIALDLTPNQKELLSQHAGYARVAYNDALNDFKDGLENFDWYNGYTLLVRWNKRKKELYPWSKELSQYSSKHALLNLGNAIKRWSDYRQKVSMVGIKNAGKKVGFPKYKKLKDGRRFHGDNGSNTVKVNGKWLKMIKIEPLKMRQELRFNGIIRTCAISEIAGKWYASITVDDGILEPELRGGDTIGIDMGVKTLATCFNNYTGKIYSFDNPKPLEKYLIELRKVDKSISRSKNFHGKTNYSNRRQKLYLKRQRLYKKISDIRNDTHHKATTEIVNQSGVIKVETLNIQNMQGNKELNRVIRDTGMNEFIRQLEYKCRWNGVQFIKVAKFYPSTQLCSNCGSKQKLSLDIRTYKCKKCELQIDRDINAAINIANWSESLPDLINMEMI